MDRGLEEAVEGGTWIFLGNFVVSLSGVVFWLAVARLSGVDVVGLAGALVSAAGIAVTLASSGLGLAVAREVAVGGPVAAAAGLVLAFVLGGVAGLLGWLLAGVLVGGRGFLAVYTGVLALSMVVSQGLQFTLVGLERFRGLFAASTVGSAAKLVVAAALALAGYRVAAPLLGLMAYPLIAGAAALALSARQVARGLRGLSLGRVASLAALAASNYPFMLSSQLLAVLSVYAYALLSGVGASTGVLYISMMASLAAAMIPMSILNASLPISARRGGDPFSDALRLGLSLATPLIAAVAAAPGELLSLVNPELSTGSTVLLVLLLAVTPATVLAAATIKLNKEARRRGIALIGTARLAVLLALIAPLTSAHGAMGAALAFLAANVAPLPLALRELPSAARPALTLWLIQALTPGILGLAGIPWQAAVILAPPLALAALHATGAARLGELVNVARLALQAITRGSPAAGG